MSDTRYQHQPWYVKVWRQIIWEPYRWWYFLSCLAVWGWYGFKPLEADYPCYQLDGSVEMVTHYESRKELLSTYWHISASMKSIKMQWHYTTEEMLELL